MSNENQNVNDLDAELPVASDVAEFRRVRAEYCNKAGVTPREAYRRVLEAAVKDGWDRADFEAPMTGATWLERTLYLKAVAVEEGIILTA